MWKSAEALPLSAAQRADLDALGRSGKTPQRVVTRARIVLAAADGTAVNAIARAWDISRPTVYLWRGRFQEAGIVGLLKDAPRPGRRPAVSAAKVQAVVDATLHTTPPEATHWRVRTMAKAQGLSHAVVHRIWRAHGAATASGRDLQAQSGSGLCPQAPRCRRGLSPSARQSDGVVRG